MDKDNTSNIFKAEKFWELFYEAVEAGRFTKEEGMKELAKMMLEDAYEEVGPISFEEI